MSKVKVTNTFQNTYTGSKLSTYTPKAFEDLRKIYNIGPLIKRTGKEEKLQKQIDDFQKRYVCKVCGKPLSWIANTNIMTCQNPECDGIVKKTGNDTVHVPVIYYLDAKGEAVAESLFAK